ncbi:MAG TPA: sulfotransferase [Steroidobacteraceae bacterium]|nr:sulfotransferase [Steroidobacteraceae bacterium]
MARAIDAERAVQEALRRRDFAAALATAHHLQRSDPRSATGWLMEHEILRAQGKPAEALAAAQQAVQVDQRSVRAWLQLALSLRSLRRWNESRAALTSAEATAERAEEWAQVGGALTHAGQHSRACAAYDRAVSLDPSRPVYFFNRAASRRFLGQLAEAERDYDRVINFDPDDVEAWLNRSELRTQTPENNHLQALEARLAHGFPRPVNEVPIRYALAKEYEDLADYASSWKHLVAGAQLRRRHLQYDVRADVATVDWIIEAFAAAGSGIHGLGTEEPIFIVGMPRTGTTLLERLLAGHRDVFAAGELTSFAEAVVSAAQSKLGRVPRDRRELVATSAQVDFAALGADYLDRSRATTGHTARFTDKMPLNYLYCGIIRRALPRARILHLTRHPLATCYAVYKILFNQGYPFSYDLGEIAEYYIAYRRLMAHWHSVHPGQILEVSYERLVQEPQAESRRVFEFCGLEWDPTVTEVSARAGPSTTASAAQIRRPIYSTSVDSWRHYAEGLRPVAERLRRAGIEIPQSQ